VIEEGDKMTITEVAKLYDISADTLRYYERIGLIPPVLRTKSGNRDYDKESCSWIELAKCMRSAGVTIEALIEYCALTQRGDSTITARKELLIDERVKILEKMDEMQKTLERLNYKISVYAEAEKTGILEWKN
jgi:DNA-binding transcriptional MerR regulator